MGEVDDVDELYGEENGKVKIIILTTGGTIEKTYDELDGSLANRASAIKSKILAKLRLPYTEVIIRPILAKDSLIMDDGDRDVIFQALEKYRQQNHPIVVLHGTDTLHLSASYCLKRIPRPNVPIIFTGAMRPLEFDNTDSKQNVTEALMVAKIVPPGFYLSFHNRLFRIPYIRKNRKRKTFESGPFSKESD